MRCNFLANRLPQNSANAGKLADHEGGMLTLAFT